MSKKIKKIIVIVIIALLISFATGIIYFVIKKDANSIIDFSKYSTSSITKATTIKKSGIYNITGNINGQVLIDAKDGEVKLVLNNSTIKTTNAPGIYVKNAKTVYIELKGENTLDGTTTTELNGLIYSKSDLTIQGNGSINITSNIDGIVSKDNLSILSGTYIIKVEDDGIVGKDSVYIKDGNITINSNHDGIKATNEKSGTIKIESGTFNITTGNGADTKTTEKDFNSKSNKNSTSIKGIKAVGDIEIINGTFTINSQDDSIHSNANIKIDGGTFKLESSGDGIHSDVLLEINNGNFDIAASEGLESTYLKVNDGTINISASDDGINAANKSNKYTPTVEINGGSITIRMGAGDTDGIDSNGNLYINGGTLNITGNSPFDYDGEAKYTNGTMIVNGEEINTITNQMIGGGRHSGNINGSPDQGSHGQGDHPQDRGNNQRGPRGNYG